MSSAPSLEPSGDPLKVLLISGSVALSSHTRALCHAVAATVTGLGAEATVWDLREEPLPIADPIFHDDAREHPDPMVQMFVKTADQADAFVLSSPVYHNSYSGVLKNALDHLVIRHLAYKPVGLVSHGGNRSTQVVDHLRIVVRGLLGVAIPTQVCTVDDDYGRSRSGDYQLAVAPIGERVLRLGTELVAFAHAMAPLR